MRAIVLLACAACLLASTAVTSQIRFVDDAKREVTVPPRVNGVFAAGAPAEVLLYTLAPEKLVGRNRVPEGDAVEFFPPQFRNPVFIRQLPEVDNPAADADVLALRPDLYVDYGSVHEDYIAAVNAVQRRTRVPGILLDGRLSAIPETYRRLGAAMGIATRGDQLAAAAARILQKYRHAAPASRVYLACSADGYLPCLADQTAGEQLAWLGGVNVAGTSSTAPKRPFTIDEIAALKPQVVIVNGPPARLRSDPAWQRIEAVAAGHVYQWPALPYSWGSRPPSVNRLPGLMWLANVTARKPSDSELRDEVRAFFRDFYHLELTDAQMQKLLPR